MVKAIAELTGCPWEWMFPVTMSTVTSRWLESITSLVDKARRLVTVSVKVNWYMIIPAENIEGISGMFALETLMSRPMDNVTRVFRYHALEEFGHEAGIQVTLVEQPMMSTVPWVPTLAPINITENETRIGGKYATASSPRKPNLHSVVVVVMAMICWTSLIPGPKDSATDT